MPPSYRTEITLTEDGKLSLDNLPFRAGQVVEVIVLPAVTSPHRLPGSVLRYDDPTAPVADTDWGVLQ